MNKYLSKLEPIVFLAVLLGSPFYLKQLWENFDWITNTDARGAVFGIVVIIFTSIYAAYMVGK